VVEWLDLVLTPEFLKTKRRRTVIQKTLSFGVINLLLLLPLFMAHSQVTSPEISRLQKLQERKIAEKEKAFQELQTKLLEQSFERGINPEQYIVGPGDAFAIVIWGESEGPIQATVTPEGQLVIPTIGAIEVDGLTLKEVQQKVAEVGSKRYRNRPVTAYLMGVRKIRVHVLGDVRKPGTYVATPLDRVSDLIQRAEGLNWSAQEGCIELRRANGQKRLINYDKFRREGDLSENPTVLGGDVIFVPQARVPEELVRLEGQLGGVGWYVFQPGETLMQFLRRVGALSRAVDLKGVLVKRMGSDSDNYQIFSLNLTDGEGRNFVLQSGDVILLPSINRNVYVRGAVQTPGAYTYYPGLKARDYVGLAGGTQEAGSLASTKVIHARDHSVEKGPDVEVEGGDTVVVPLKFRASLPQYLQIIGQIATILIAASAIGLIKPK